MWERFICASSQSALHAASLLSALTPLPQGSQMMRWPFHLIQDCSVTHSMNWKVILSLNTSHRSLLSSSTCIWFELCFARKGQNSLWKITLILKTKLSRVAAISCYMNYYWFTSGNNYFFRALKKKQFPEFMTWWLKTVHKPRGEQQ